jgi:hypothetical protein
MRDPNLQMLEDAVRKLGTFLDEIVFVGGVTLGLLITDKAAAPIRGTTDVDVIAEIVTYADYIAFSERLRLAHFTEDTGLTRRWHNGALMLDVLALNKEVLGFTNIWYEPALRHAFTATLPGGQTIRVIAAPFFLATKMEAFRGRGRMDFQASHDLEDFVAVIEGRDTLLPRDSRFSSSSSGLSSRSSKDFARGVSISRCASRICLRGRTSPSHSRTACANCSRFPVSIEGVLMADTARSRQ